MTDTRLPVHKMEFAYRLNSNDTHDSICLNCFQTVGTARTKADLGDLESQHTAICWKRNRWHDPANANAAD